VNINKRWDFNIHFIQISETCLFTATENVLWQMPWFSTTR